MFIMVIAFGHSQALGTNLSTSGTDSKSSQEHIGSQLTTNVEQEKITKTQETQTQH